MANKKISQLPTAPVVTTSLQFEVNDNSVSKKITWQQILNALGTTLTTSNEDTNFTIPNNNTIGQYYVNADTRQVIAELPTLADNLGVVIRIYNTVIGMCTARRKTGTADVIRIDGNDHTEISLYWEGDYIDLIGETTGWRVTKGRSKLDPGWRNTDDWNNRHLGYLEFDIDAGAAPDLGFYLGEVVQEETSNFECRIYDITDNGDGTGTFWGYNIDGNLTNNREITGQSSGATADVDEATGSTKNLDSYLLNNFGENLSDRNISSEIFISTDGTENNARKIDSAFSRGGDAADGHNFIINQIDTNQIDYHIGKDGGLLFQADGSALFLDIEDYYYKNPIIWRI